MKIGLFFGSFNPIHNGHLAIANFMVKNGGINKLWFVVSPQNPFKDKGDLLEDKLRFEMVELAIAKNKHFKACDVEFNLSKPSYTINTLEFLHSQYPDYEFYLIMGADNFINIDKWKEYEKIICEYRFLIYPRPGFAAGIPELKGNFAIIEAPLMDISSTAIRKAISEKNDIRHLLPDAVLRFIKQNNLYSK